VFHAGTKKEGSTYYTAGGRVLGVTAMADVLDAALSKAYKSVQKIKFKDMHYRKDIGRV
jgi:phosphoribosylamine--glycine ligase